MKLIARIDSSPSATGGTDAAGAFLAWPDSCMLISHRPLYIPESNEGFMAVPALAFRIKHLGKGITPKFALRYIGDYSAALILMPASALRRLRLDGMPLPGELCFDNALVVGQWQEISFPSRPLQEAEAREAMRVSLPETFLISMRKLGSDKASDIQCSRVPVDAGDLPSFLARVSETNTLKTGDVLLLPAIGAAFPARCDTLLSICAECRPDSITPTGEELPENLLLSTKFK